MTSTFGNPLSPAVWCGTHQRAILKGRCDICVRLDNGQVDHSIVYRNGDIVRTVDDTVGIITSEDGTGASKFAVDPVKGFQKPYYHAWYSALHFTERIARSPIHDLEAKGPQ